MADQLALNDVLGCPEAEKIFNATGQHRSQMKGNGCRRQIQIRLNRRHRLPRDACTSSKFALRKTFLGTERFEVIGKLGGRFCRVIRSFHGH